MLISTYSANVGKVLNSTDQMSEAQIKLLNLIRSKGRLEQLLEVLPEGWENNFEIIYYDDPKKVYFEFREERISKGSRVVYDRKVPYVIFNKQPANGNDKNTPFKYNAVPAKYDEYKRRDYDYPVEENVWKTDTDLSEYSAASFHVDHKLIWIIQQRETDISSNINIEDVPWKYSINIYVPTEETLIEVEKLKKLGVH